MATMTPDEADATYGKIVYRSATTVVRLKVTDLHVEIFVHKVKDDTEQLPLGYMLGHNFLTYPR